MRELRVTSKGHGNSRFMAHMESVGLFHLLHCIHIVKYFVFSPATSVMLVVHGGGVEICTCLETTQIIDVHVFLDKHIGVLGYIMGSSCQR